MKRRWGHGKIKKDFKGWDSDDKSGDRAAIF